MVKAKRTHAHNNVRGTHAGWLNGELWKLSWGLAQNGAVRRVVPCG